MFAGIAARISDWIVAGAQKVAMLPVRTALRILMSDNTDPRFDADGFFVAGTAGGGSPYGKVMFIALLLMVIFLVAAVIGSILRGEASQAVRAVAFDMPIAIGLMVFAVAIVAQLVRVTNEISDFFLANARDDLEAYVTHLAQENVVGGWLFALLIAILTFIAGILLILILVLRMAFIYLVVAFMPLIFASMVWPSLRQSLRKGIEILLGLLFTKPAIALAIAVGSAALGSVLDTEEQQIATFEVYCADGSNQADCPPGSSSDLLYVQGQRHVHPVMPLSGDDVARWNERFIGDADNPNDGYPANATSSGIYVDSRYRLSVVDLFEIDSFNELIASGTGNGTFDPRPCSANALASSRIRVRCNPAEFQPGGSVNRIVVVGDLVFQDLSDGNSRLVGMIGERANVAANSAGWRLLPVDQSRALLIPDLTSADNPATADINESVDVSREELERGITVSLDTAFMRQLVSGISATSGSTATTVPGATPVTTAPATRASNPSVTRGDTQMFGFFNCTYAGAALDRQQPAFRTPRYDYEGCLMTQSGDDGSLEPDRPVVEDDGAVYFNRVQIGRVLDVTDDGSDGSFMVQLSGALLMLIAGFAPFLLLRLFPLLDLAVLSQAAEKPFSKVGSFGLNLGAVIDLPKNIRRIPSMFKADKPAAPGGGSRQDGSSDSGKKETVYSPGKKPRQAVAPNPKYKVVPGNGGDGGGNGAGGNGNGGNDNGGGGDGGGNGTPWGSPQTPINVPNALWAPPQTPINVPNALWAPPQTPINVPNALWAPPSVSLTPSVAQFNNLAQQLGFGSGQHLSRVASQSAPASPAAQPNGPQLPPPSIATAAQPSVAAPTVASRRANNWLPPVIPANGPQTPPFQAPQAAPVAQSSQIPQAAAPAPAPAPTPSTPRNASRRGQVWTVAASGPSRPIKAPRP